MGKVKRNIKRIICLILLLVFSPIILIYLIVKSITKSARKRVWKKSGISSRQLILGTDITIIDKMEDFEADDYFKYLFFYDGFNSKLLKGKRKPNFLLFKNNETYSLKYNIDKNQSLKQDIKILSEYSKKNNIKHSFYVTNRSIDNKIYDEYISQGIKIVDREDLITLYTRTIARLKMDNVHSDNLSTKPILEQLDDMYPSRI